ncbi:MAG: Tat pathway signal protein, partial [Terriglobales bacterium]
PTRWGKVSLEMSSKVSEKRVGAIVNIARSGSPKEIQVKFRLPQGSPLQAATVNGRAGIIGGPHHDVVIISTGVERHFVVAAQYS